MSEEKEPVQGDETEAPKRGGRPRKTAEPKKPESADKPAESSDENSEKDSEAKEDQAAEKEKLAEKADTSTAPSGRIVQKDEDVELKTKDVDGTKVASETVHRKVLLPNSSRFTYILVATEGTRVD